VAGDRGGHRAGGGTGEVSLKGGRTGRADRFGALGLILPGLLRIRTGLMPIAAVGLTIIMIGAVGTTTVTAGAVPALMPGVAGVVAATVAIGRWREAGTATRRSVLEARTAQLAEVG
jgi:hypothetical protein